MDNQNTYFIDIHQSHRKEVLRMIQSNSDIRELYVGHDNRQIQPGEAYKIPFKMDADVVKSS